jgi:hypothetical protein
MRAVLLVVLMSVPLLGQAQTVGVGSDQQQFVGTWRLLSYVGVQVPAGAKSDVMGPHPSGYINYGADGRMIVIIVAGERKKPAGTLATPEEAQALLRSLLAYAGTYTVDATAKTVTHHIEVSWDETRTGESHIRTYKLDGDRLILTTQPSRDPASGLQTVRTLLWQRVK